MAKLSYLTTVLLFTVFYPNTVSSNDTEVWNYQPFLEENTTVSSHINETKGKHEFLAHCLSFQLEPSEYMLFENGTVYVEAYNKVYNESFYVLSNGILTVCVPETQEEVNEPVKVINSSQFEHITMVGLVISMVCLLVHLFVFFIVPDLRNLPGYNMASLCLSLFCAYVFYFVSYSETVGSNGGLCVTVGSLIQFFFLASFLWMSVMAFDVFRSLILATSLRCSNTNFTVNKYLIYCLFSWGVALLFVVATLLADNLEGVPELYRPAFVETCWFKNKKSLTAFFAGPVLTLICVNFILFGLSAYVIFVNRLRNDQDSHRTALKKNYLLYFRLAVIMGVAWVTGLVAPFVKSEWIWYSYSALNSLQGLFIFLAFTCTGKVVKHFRTVLIGGRRPSQQTLAPTFQSYCFYANSIEKDLDKVVDKEKEKSDMIIIHL